MKLTLIILFCAIFAPYVHAETGPLKQFGVPKGFQYASAEVLKGFQMPQAYGFVIGDEGETNEIWLLQSKASFEMSISKLTAWFEKNRLTIVQLECGSQQNQQCEFMARNEKGSISVNLASAMPKQDLRIMIVRMEGPETGK